jgi:heme a synthase
MTHSAPAVASAALDRAPHWLKPLAWATLVTNIVLVVTGGAVRLTGSGLGCPTWPRCADGDLTPRADLNVHSAIEFGNRMLTFVLVAVAIATVLAAWRTAQRWLSIVILLGIPVQAVIGGISVLTKLNPWIVSIHLVSSMAIVSLAVLLLWRVHAGRPAVTSGPVVWLGWANYVVAWLVIYVGTMVTGAGPHAGDAHSKRNGLSVLETAQAHADLVCLFIGLTIGLVVLAHALRAPVATRNAGWILLGVEASQAAIGWVQYFTHVPIVLVMFHMLGAGLIAAAVTWVLLRVREPVADDPRTA